MLELYKTENCDVHAKAERLILRKTGSCNILLTESGKPYIEGNPLYFSLSHTFDRAFIALSDKPVGVDAERITPRKATAILKRFTPSERAEIRGDNLRFLQNWVIKEAYIKLLGGTLATHLKRLEVRAGELFCDGEKVNCSVTLSTDGDCVYAVCAEQTDLVEEFEL